MTERLYFDDPYRTDFDAAVVRSVEVDGKPGIILDQTCFYPTAGGQGCDRGFLNDVPVIDVLEGADEILHITERGVTAENVSGKIDWNRRFDFMQQHSAASWSREAECSSCHNPEAFCRGCHLDRGLGAAEGRTDTGIKQV